MLTEFDETSNTPDDRVPGDTRTADTSKIQAHRNVASKSKPQGVATETIAKEERGGKEEQSRERDNSIADSVAAARKLPVVAPRPTPRGLQQRLEIDMDQNYGA